MDKHIITHNAIFVHCSFYLIQLTCEFFLFTMMVHTLNCSNLMKYFLIRLKSIPTFVKKGNDTQYKP